MESRSRELFGESVKTFENSLLKFLEFHFGEGRKVMVERMVVGVDDGVRSKVDFFCNFGDGYFESWQTSVLEGDGLKEDEPFGKEFTDYMRSQGFVTGPEILARQDVVLS